jgi:hypothetical protein
LSSREVERNSWNAHFKFRNQIPTLSSVTLFGTLIAKFLDPEINLSPKPVLNDDGSIKHPGMDNHSMGTVFEELVRGFNEENNEEAGEHWTPRDVVKLMANLIFLPIAGAIQVSVGLIFEADGFGESRLRRVRPNRRRECGFLGRVVPQPKSASEISSGVERTRHWFVRILADAQR